MKLKSNKTKKDDEVKTVVKPTEVTVEPLIEKTEPIITTVETIEQGAEETEEELDVVDPAPEEQNPNKKVHVLRKGVNDLYQSPASAMDLITLYPKVYTLGPGENLQDVRKRAMEELNLPTDDKPGTLTRRYLDSFDDLDSLVDIYINLVKDAPDTAWDKNKLIDEILLAQDNIRKKEEELV